MGFGLLPTRSRNNHVRARFTQGDEYRGDGLNIYAYCDNNPVGYYNPSGYVACEKVAIGKNKTEELGNANSEVKEPFLNATQESMSVPANSNGTYFSFNKYDVANPGALQVPHDASYRTSFDTIQVIDDIRVRHGQCGGANYLEPLTNDYPQFGHGGAA